MIHKDNLGLVVDVSGDGGDSAHFTGLYLISKPYYDLKLPDINLPLYFVREGEGIRHPTQVPWNNPGNFTRDQMMPLAAMLYKMGYYVEAKKIFAATLKRFGFAQNFERDYPGSKKYPYPHTFVNMKGVTETRKFDFADPLYPHQLAALAKAAGYDGLVTMTKPIWYPFLLLELISYRYSDNEDMGQIISTCFLLGELVTFKKIVSGYREKLRGYFNGWRSKQELCKQMEGWLETNL